MRRPPLHLAPCLLLGMVAACSGGTSQPAALGDVPGAPGGTTLPYAGEAGIAADAGANDASSADGSVTASDAGADATTTTTGGDGGADATTDAATSPASDAQPPLATLCDPGARWGPAIAIDGLPVLAASVPFAISADERTAAWLEDDGNGRGTLRTADRREATSSFGSSHATTITGGNGAVYFSLAGGIGLAADGLSLVGVRLDGLGMGQAMRFTRPSTWVPSAIEGSFLGFDAELNPGEVLSDPVLSTDGATLLYSRTGKDPSTTVYESHRTTSDWPNGVAHSEAALAAGSGGRKRPTYLSADGLSLFAWDAVTATSTFYFRPAATGRFTAVADLGARRSVTANLACTRLYYLAASGGAWRGYFNDRL